MSTSLVSYGYFYTVRLQDLAAEIYKWKIQAVSQCQYQGLPKTFLAVCAWTETLE